MRLPLLKRPSFYGKWLPAAAVVIYAGFGCSCSKSAETGPPPADTKELTFESVVTGYNKTRAYDAQWTEDDAIGIFMFESGAVAGQATELANNREYVTGGDGRFMAATAADRLRLTADDAPVDLIAYYPHSQYVTPPPTYILSLDLSEQSFPEDIDLLYSNNVSGLTASSGTPILSFDHVLSKIVLNVTNSGVSGLDKLSIKAKGLPVTGEFDLLNGTLTPDGTSVQDIDMYIYTTADGKTAEALVMPTADASGVSFEITLGDEVFRFDFPAASLESGGRYTYGVELKSQGPPTVEPVRGWVELPESASTISGTYTSTHFMESGRNYTLFYDTNYKMAYWVAYPLVADHLGSISRTDKWVADPNIPSSDQPVLTYSYTDSAYDRGHQIPSGDRTNTRLANSQTFYFTNSTPQMSRFNQDGWVTMEDKVRAYCRNCDTLYVVTGAILPADGLIDWKVDRQGIQSATPSHYYKALARRVGDSYSTVGFLFDHVSTPKNINTDNYKVTVKELEEKTGFTFFPGLADELKTNTNTAGW